MLRQLILLTSVAALLGSGEGRAQTAEEWIVEMVLPPAPRVPDELSRWHWPTAQGDLNHDLRTDFIMQGTSDAEPFTGGYSWNQLWIYTGALAEPAHTITTRGTDQFFSTDHIHLPLKTPRGWAILRDSGLLTSIEAYDMLTGLRLGIVKLPPPPAPGIPAAGGFDAVYPAGDVNHDGWDDAFWVTWTVPWIHAGLIDGATLTVAWQYYDGDDFYPHDPSFGEPSTLPDLDGDQVPDYLFIFSTYANSLFGHVAVALSGRNGAVIWRRQGAGISTQGNTWGKDLNNDGTEDGILTIGQDSIIAMDGRTGTTIWTQDYDILDPFFSGGYRARHLSRSAMSRSVITGETEIVLAVDYVYPVGNDEWKMIHLDGATGQITAVADHPQDIQPWSDAPLMSNIYNFWLMGDIDRDGLMEFGVPFYAWDLTPSWSIYPAIAYAVYGQHTLFLPANARIGTAVQADISIPSAGGMGYALVFSTKFAPLGGWTPGGVQTNLDPTDPIFQSTLGRPDLRGRLGPQGKGRLSFALPMQAGLIGKTLHVRAVVRQPVTGEVWTVSSPASLLITQ